MVILTVIQKIVDHKRAVPPTDKDDFKYNMSIDGADYAAKSVLIFMML